MKFKFVLSLMLCLIAVVSCSTDSNTLSVNPSKVDFGDVYLGDSEDITLTLKNKYDDDISITSLTIDEVGNSYSISGSVATPFDLAKGAEYSLTITFKPTTENIIDAKLIINHTGSTKDKEVNLTGNGVPVARIQVSESSYDFGNKLNNKTHTHNFEIENVGTAALEITDMTFSGTGASAYSITAGDAPVNILPGALHTVTVTFSPTAVTTYPTDLAISHNAINETSPYTIHYDGAGINLDPQITLSTGKTWDFGSVATTLPGYQLCEIDNSGIDPLTVTSATLTNANEFSVDTLLDANGNTVSFPQTVAVGGHLLLYVKFAPGSKTTFNDTLSIVHDGTNENSPLDVSLSGIGRDELSKTFTYSALIENWVVPSQVRFIRIEAWGGQGGGPRGGKGAYVRGDFIVTPGETLKILVAENGYITAQGDYGAGGGGGSYVYRNATDPLPLIVAGGGGGQVSGLNGSGASHTETPVAGLGNGSGAGGTNGNGGNGGSNINSYSTAGGGAGWLSNGKDGVYVRNPEGKGGQCPKNGALGGVFTHPTTSWCAGKAGDGGFGGGGSMSDNSGAGGGGGGYNGGGGGNNYIGGIWGCGGGAGSYNSGLNQTGTSNTNSGNGKIIITY